MIENFIKTFILKVFNLFPNCQVKFDAFIIIGIISQYFNSLNKHFYSGFIDNLLNMIVFCQKHLFESTEKKLAMTSL